MKKMWKGLRRFFKRSDEKFTNVNLEDANIFKRILFIVLSNIKTIVVLMCVFVFISLIVTYTGSFNKKSVVLSLNYEEASKGQNPNLTRYNVYELKSDRVMERVIGNAGLQDVLTPTELSKHIDIAENSSGKTIDPNDSSTYYISTSYTVSYRMNREIKNISVDDMMTLICKSYNDMFHEEYVGTKSVLKYDLGDIDGKEYIEIAKLFTNKSDQMLRYIQQRIEENATYRSEITGQSFQTIKKMIQNVQNYSIKKYSAFVLESGLSRNKDHYIRTLNYKNDMLNITCQQGGCHDATRCEHRVRAADVGRSRRHRRWGGRLRGVVHGLAVGAQGGVLERQGGQRGLCVDAFVGYGSPAGQSRRVGEGEQGHHRATAGLGE